MNPSGTLSSLRPDLGASLEQFDLAMDRQGFIALQVLPVIETAVASGTFGKIPLKELLKNAETRRTSRSNYNRGDWQFTEDNFATKEYGFEEPVDDRDAKLYANYFDAEMIAVELARDTVMRAHEKRVADLLFNATTWTGASLTTAVTNEWDDATNATPIDDVEAAVTKVYDLTGMWPNALIINRKVFRNLRKCDQIIERIASQGAGSATKAKDITAAQLAAVFDLSKIVIAGSSRNSANEGQNASLSQIWSNEYAMVARLAETNNIKEPCLGRTFHWGADGSEIGGTIESYYSNEVRGDVERCRHEVHEKVLYTEMAHLLSNITT